MPEGHEASFTSILIPLEVAVAIRTSECQSWRGWLPIATLCTADGGDVSEFSSFLGSDDD
jgi:hypothetical protein